MQGSREMRRSLATTRRSTCQQGAKSIWQAMQRSSDATIYKTHANAQKCVYRTSDTDAEVEWITALQQLKHSEHSLMTGSSPEDNSSQCGVINPARQCCDTTASNNSSTVLPSSSGVNSVIKHNDSLRPLRPLSTPICNAKH